MLIELILLDDEVKKTLFVLGSNGTPVLDGFHFYFIRIIGI